MGKKIGTGNSSKKGQKWAICTIYVVFWFGFGSVTEPLGSVVRPNLTEPPSLAEPEPEAEWFGRSLHIDMYLSVIAGVLTKTVLPGRASLIN